MACLERVRDTAVGRRLAGCEFGYWASIVFTAATACVPVVAGLTFAVSVLNVAHPPGGGPATLSAVASRHDGVFYREVVVEGYTYDPGARSVVAFFPGYPLVASLLLACFPVTPEVALLLASNTMLLAFSLLFIAYCRSRFPRAAAAEHRLLLMIILLFPTSFFFRVAYSESTLLAAMSLFLLGLARGWPLVPLALVAGLATATRPVGLACTAAFLAHLFTQQDGGSLRRRAALSLALSPLAAWGLLAYMAYQQHRFHTPIAFAQTQQYWDVRSRPVSWADKAASLLTFEPVCLVYDPNSRAYWRNAEVVKHPLCSLAFWNPIVFVSAAGLVAAGWALRWLTGPEVVLGLALLAIPYVTRAYEMAMGSQARFASVDIPAYLVFGRLLWLLPHWAGYAAVVVFSSVLVIWSALFFSGYPLY